MIRPCGAVTRLRLSGQAPLRDQVRELLRERGLPVTFSGTSVEAVLEATARDKKRVGETVPFVLVREPGDVSIGHEVALEDLRAAVAELAS